MLNQVPKRATFTRAMVVAFLIAAVVAQMLPTPALADPRRGLSFNTLRIYGRNNEGPGERVLDPVTSRSVEDLPYTDPQAVFMPQRPQAPRKDSVTWNPIWMYENQTFDENQARDLYDQIFAGGLNASEKVWFREWYEPDHWDKDLNADGELDSADEHYPAIMQEFTYLLMEPKFIEAKPEPYWGRVGQTSFVFPIGMRKDDLLDRNNNVDTTSENARYGYGLTSLDANFDGMPDIVHVESELTLFDQTQIGADFDGDGALDPLDRDDIALNGNELAVLRLNTMPVARGGYIQFLDHVVRLRDVFDDSVLLDIWYTGDIVPHRFNRPITLYLRDMALAGSDGPAQLITAVRNGGTGTNMCNFPTGPWFVWLASVDTVEESARLMVGRAVGNTWTGMEDQPNLADRRPGDPWFLKRFYVDGHEYNVVALYTRNGQDIEYKRDCDLDDNDDGRVDLAGPPDYTEFQFITIRTPIPKVPVLIEQHSVYLQDYKPLDYLSVLPPYNYEHYILADIQIINEFADYLSEVQFIGKLIGPVPPILQKNGPFCYVVRDGDRDPIYCDIREMYHFYVREQRNPQYEGQLLQLYGEEIDPGEPQDPEYWYAERWLTLPWEYTELVFPDIREEITGANDPDLYLLTSAFIAPQAEYYRWIQDNPAPERWIGDRVKFWFDPHTGGKKYKDELGIRIYGRDHEGAGNITVEDPKNPTYPVEVPPYTDRLAPFNPKLPQAPRKDSLTFNPAYMSEFNNGREPLSSLYNDISIEEQNAREKVFFRMWYEPEYLDKILRVSPREEYTFPALLQEFTYMFVDMQGNIGMPSHGQPGTSHFAFPIGTTAIQLPAPIDGDIPPTLKPSCGYGLTTFDADFDGLHDIVTIHSERSLAAMTGIGADFDGNGAIDQLVTQEGIAAGSIHGLSGEELVVFTVENITLRRGESAMFLDHMVTLENVTPNGAEMQFWYTGGGLHAYPNGVYSLHPDRVQLASLYGVRDMAIVNRTQVRRIPAGSSNLGQLYGAWFCWVQAINTTQPARETVNLVIGRALGATHSAIDNGRGQHDLEPGDPWYLKRFFVDGHEYNVVAIKTMPADVINPGDEGYEFKYITIRTPVPKVNFVNYQDSQKLEGYFLGTNLCGDTSIISVMPPFNFEHTIVRDIERFRDRDCVGDLVYNRPPLVIRIVDEDREPQFFGELKELLFTRYKLPEIWSTEQFNTLPDRYTEVQLPAGEDYLLTSDWTSDESELTYDSCGLRVPLPVPPDAPRVQFWYDPTDPYDIYINDPWIDCLPVTIRGVVYLYQGPCHATHYLLTPEGGMILVYEPSGTLSRYIGRDVTISGCWYDTLLCIPGVQIVDPSQIIVHEPFTPTPTHTLPPTTPTRTPTATATHTSTTVPTATPTGTPPTIPPRPTATATATGTPFTPTPTVTGTPPTPTLTRTPQAGTGHISGLVQLEGRSDYSGASVSVPAVPGANTTTGSNGAYTLYDVPVGVHTIIADISRYLYAQKSDVNVTAGNTTVLPDVNLHGGDANDDAVVDIFDLVILGLAYNSTPADPDWDPRADINNDSAVNLWDLVLVGTNYNRTAPTSWSILFAPRSAAQAMVELPKAKLVAVEESSNPLVELWVEGSQLYGAEFELSFDPSVLAVRDADLGRNGVQIESGEMFAAGNAFVVQNNVDNVKGTVRYAVTLLRPAKSFSGNGVLARIRFSVNELAARSSKKTAISLQRLALYSEADEDMHLISGAKLLLRVPAPEKAKLPPMLLKDVER